MRFLLDENIDIRLADVLAQLGHDATAIARDYPASLEDVDVLAIAVRERRILITNDQDFGELVVRERRPHAGVILFRVRPATFAHQRDRLAQVLDEYADRLQHFIVVESNRVRIHRTTPEP